jgi:putative membrane protein
MHAIRWMTLSAAALALAGCGSKTETTSTDTTVTTNSETSGMTNDMAMPPAATASAGQSFANAAAASDAFEIGTSQLAQAQGQSAAIKKFADSMIKAHTESTAKLKVAAGTATPAITPDATLTADQQAGYEKLKALNGADFDKAYAAAQVDAHQKTLDALKANADNKDVPQPLRDFATKLIPTVTAHLNMAKGLK